jgi:protein O-GlcNAc transferase
MNPHKAAAPGAPTSSSQADVLVAAGVRHHRAGQLAEAEKSYRAALAHRSDHPDALHLLGVIALQVQRYDAAVELIGQAVRVSGDNPAFLASLGLALLHQGKFEGALPMLDRALALKPDYVEVLHNRGRVLQQLGRLDEALVSYRQAVAVSPGLAEAHNNSSAILREMGRFEEALAAFERASALKPDLATAWLSCGDLLFGLRQFEKALRSIDSALERDPGLAGAWLSRGNACAGLGRQADALAAFDRALNINPALVGAWVGRGNVLCECDRHDEALRCYDRALELDSRLASVWLGCGNAFAAERRYEDALAAYDMALGLDPGFSGAWLGRGNVLRELTRADDAIAAYDEALRIEPGLAQAHLGRGNVLSELRRGDAALSAYDKAIALRPDLAEAWLGRGHVLREAGRFVEALAAYDEASKLKPRLPGVQGARLKAKMQVCDWSNFDAERAQLLASLQSAQIVQPFDLLSLSLSARDQYQCAKLFSHRSWPQVSREARSRRPPARERIRLAYISADFRQHPMAYLMADIFEHHDTSLFDVTAISIGPDDGSATRRRLEAAFERFVDARTLTDAEIAGLLEDLEVDIVVDLMGYTRGARTGVIARRPAPVQVNYLGFPGTTGSAHIDYIIADRVVIPGASRQFFAEKVACLPFTYYPGGRAPRSDKTPARRDVGLPADAFVFSCFNNSFKILPDVFESWMRILKQVEGSVLWLLEDNALAAVNLRREATARGIAGERLIFAPRVQQADHLARQPCADLFTDTLPYNAHTTALDALWEGVPVLTRIGETFAGRVAASLLTALDLPELIVETADDYERLAIELALYPERLSSLKRKIREKRAETSLFDTKRFTTHMESAYAMMVERHRAGLAPDHFVVSA